MLIGPVAFANSNPTVTAVSPSADHEFVMHGLSGYSYRHLSRLIAIRQVWTNVRVYVDLHTLCIGIDQSRRRWCPISRLLSARCSSQYLKNYRHLFHSVPGAAKITVFDPIMCKSPNVPLQDELPAENQPTFTTCMHWITNSSWAHDQHSANLDFTVCTVVQNSCKGRSNKYRKWHFEGCYPLPEKPVNRLERLKLQTSTLYADWG